MCLPIYGSNKLVHINKKPKENWYIYTLKQDLIVWFVDIVRQTLKS